MRPNLTYLYEDTPVWLDTFFILTTVLMLLLLYLVIRQISIVDAIKLLVVGLVWLAVLAWLAYNHVFQPSNAKPPRFVLCLGPPLFMIICLFATVRGRFWIDQLSLSTLTRLHLIRLPVELTLYGLYRYHQIPQLMTFEGHNYDILAGLTAPFVAYYCCNLRRTPIRWLMIWNVLALGLVLTIIGLAILSIPSPFQQLAFEQPNVGLLKAPYIWLPGFIVPAVLFSHAVVLYRLANDRSSYRS